jgi:uncharacterized Fe-S cluster protein YjdI
MAESTRRSYEGAQVSVSFDAQRCLHAAECVRGLPSVFDTSKRPWIEPDGAAPDEVAEVVRRCPSGALRYEMRSGEPERADAPTSIVLREGGGIALRGDLRLATAEGDLRETRAVLCNCRRTAHSPFCDNSCRT